MDFREFSKAYNDYLCHGLTIGERARGKEKTDPDRENTIRKFRIIARYVENPGLKEMLYSYGRGLTVGRLDEAFEIAQSGLNDQTKTRLIEDVLSGSKNTYKKVNARHYSSLKHCYNDFRDFSEQYFVKNR